VHIENDMVQEEIAIVVLLLDSNLVSVTGSLININNIDLILTLSCS